MICLLLFIAVLLMAIVVFFKLPYSAVKNALENDVQYNKNRLKTRDELIAEQDIAKFPEPVQNYFRVCGYLNKPKMTSMTAFITSAPLKNTDDQPPMMVNYTLHSFANEPVRLAYIKTSVFGIPFEAFDSTQGGVGFMKGVLGKVITLFNQTGAEMDKAQLLTYLGECFLIPSSLFSDYITFEGIDSTHAKATITNKDISGSGIFTFDDKGFVESFQTSERAKVDTGGSVEYPKWSLVYDHFIDKNGIFLPTKLKTIWHESKGDFVYFDASDIDIIFNND